MRNEKEIFEMIDKANETNGNIEGATYEDGVKIALEWVLGGKEEPIEGE